MAKRKAAKIAPSQSASVLPEAQTTPCFSCRSRAVSSAERSAIEIPPTERRRAGLDEHLRLWIILDEYNEDVIGQSYYLTTEAPLGKFGRGYFLQVMKLFIARLSDVRHVAQRD